MKLNDTELEGLVHKGLELPAQKINDRTFRLLNEVMVDGLKYNQEYFKLLARGERGDVHAVTDVWLSATPFGDSWRIHFSLTPNGEKLETPNETYPNWTVAMARGYVDLKSSFPHLTIHFKTESRPFGEMAFFVLEGLAADQPDADTFRQRVIAHCDLWQSSRLFRYEALYASLSAIATCVREEIAQRQAEIDKVIEEITRSEQRTEEEQGYRSDWALVRIFAKEHGTEFARKWQHLPYVDISRKVMQNILETAESVKEHVQTLGFMPWDDFVLAIWGEHGRLWCHVEHLNNAVNLSYYQRDETGRLSHVPDRLVIPDDFPWQTPFSVDTDVIHKTDNRGRVVGLGDEVPEYITVATELICLSLAYLSQCPEHFVRVEKKPVVKQQHALGIKKPWTRQHLPSVVLLDPTKKLIDEYHEKDGSIVRELVRRQPHQRRGYWRQLRSAKYRRNEDGSIRMVPVRPTWIGPTEWEAQGKRYRVINDEVQSLH